MPRLVRDLPEPPEPGVLVEYVMVPGPAGPQGPQGPPGTGGSGSGIQNVFVQAVAPVTSEAAYLWIDTSQPSLTFWVEDGA